MDLELTDDQSELRSVAQELLDSRSPFSLARSYYGNGEGAAAALWTELGELGWSGVGLESDDPFGTPGLAILAEQLGAHATPHLVIDSAVAARTLAAINQVRAQDWAAEIAAGLSASLALLEESGDWSADADRATSAVPDGDGYRLNGVKRQVHHAGAGDLLIVAAAGVDGPVLLVVPGGSAGVAIEPETGADAANGAGRVVFEDVRVPGDSAFAEDGIADALDRCFALGAVANAAEAVGAAGAALELAVAYSLERVQYGRAIGSFQSIQHLLSDLHVQRETAWSAILYAAASFDAGLADTPQTVAVAKAHSSRASRTIVEGALQVFGGIGFTWEHDLHLVYRRALCCEQRFGSSSFHERALVDNLLQ